MLLGELLGYLLLVEVAVVLLEILIGSYVGVARALSACVLYLLFFLEGLRIR